MVQKDCMRNYMQLNKKTLNCVEKKHKAQLETKVNYIKRNMKSEILTHK